MDYLDGVLQMQFQEITRTRHEQACTMITQTEIHAIQGKTGQKNDHVT